MISAGWIQLFKGATGRAEGKSTVAKALASFTEGFFCANVYFLPFKIQLEIANTFQAFVGVG